MRFFTIKYEWENPDGSYDYDSTSYGCDEDTAREDYDILMENAAEYDSRLEECKLIYACLCYDEEYHGRTCDDGIIFEYDPKDDDDGNDPEAALIAQGYGYLVP